MEKTIKISIPIIFYDLITNKDYRVGDELQNTDKIMNNTIEYVIKKHNSM